MLLVPRQVKAAKACTINGVTYSKDDVLTGAQLKAIMRLSALLSNGTLTAVPDIHGRKAVYGGKTPTNLAPVVLAVVSASPDFEVVATLTATNKLNVSLALNGGDPPFSVAWGDTNVTSVKGRVATHTYASAGSKTVTVTAQNGDTATATFTTIAPPVISGLTATPTGLSVAFNDTVTGATSYSYSWGDGTANGTAQDPTHVYGAAGTYTATLTATGTGGVTTRTVSVTVA